MGLEQCQEQCLCRPAHGFWQLFGRFLHRLGKQIEHNSQLARQRQHLLEMDEHMLKDIGLSRADACRLAGRRWFWENPKRADDFVDERYRTSR